MSIFLNNIIIKFLFILLIFCLPLINSNLFVLLWIDLWFFVNWNYEFTKVIFFNIVSSLIIIFYLFIIMFCRVRLQSYTTYYNFIIIFFLISLFSTYVSFSPYISFFWDTSKAHSFLMWNNLIWISLILYNTIDSSFLKKINITMFISAFIVAVIWIKEYLLPSFDYWDISNRLISTFWHPNYVALFFLLTIPYWINSFLKENNQIIKTTFIIWLFIIFIALFLTKSFIAIFLSLCYLIFVILNKYLINQNILNNWKLLTLLLIFVISILFIIIYILNPEKLHSFISRFYIWESILKIIFSDIKVFFIWIWFENLINYFDNFKSPELYIFENYWLTADRPHNILLNFFVNLWLFWFILILYIYYYIFKSLKNKKYYNYSLLLWSIFLLFNFASITSYLIILIYLIYSLRNKTPFNNSSPFGYSLWKREKKIKYLRLGFFIIITFFSIINIYFSTKYYIAETYVYKNDYIEAIDIFKYNSDYYYEIWYFDDWFDIWKNKTESYYISKIRFWWNIIDWCNNLLSNFNSVENYFYCWDILTNFWYIKESNKFYKKGLEIIPDLWNHSSKYYNNYLIDKLVNKKRFYNNKYSPVKEILDIQFDKNKK